MIESSNLHADAVGAIGTAITHIAQQMVVLMLETNDELPFREENHRWLNASLAA